MRCRFNPVVMFVVAVLFVISAAAFPALAAQADKMAGHGGDASQGGLVVALSQDAKPFALMNEEGRPAGLLVDLWRIWSKRTDIPVHFRFGTWKQTVDMMATGEADAHFGIFESDERKKWMDFSWPFYPVSTNLFHRVGDVLPPIKDLGASRIVCWPLHSRRNI